MPIDKIIIEEIFNESKVKLAGAAYVVSDLKEIDYGIQFKVSKAAWSGLIRVYVNKKGNINFDFSQIKDERIKSEVSNAIENKVLERPAFQETRGMDENFAPIIGTDESGKGDYFGPLVASGVYVDERTKPQLEKIGVRDSKKINDSKIMELAALIKQICANKYSIIEIAPETYNHLYEQFKSEGKNLNTLLAWGHAKAIEEILEKVDCENALSDKFADEKFIISKLQEKGRKINLRQEHKAEANIAVAAASILARARFLEKLKKLSNDCNIHLSKGVAVSVIEEARQVVKNSGLDGLRKIAKLHFKTTELVKVNGNERNF